MSSREVVLWLDERWYKALDAQLKDETLEEHLEAVLDEMCNALPKHEYERISSEIYEEDMANRQAAEAAKRFAVFRVTEQGQEVCLQVDRGLEFLTGSRRLRPEDVSLGEEIIQNDHLLEFYMEVVFDPEEVFGLPLDRENTDDYINVYANYDMERGCVTDVLEVYLVRCGGSEEAFQYRLNAEEQAALLPKMDAYCQQRLGRSLAECCREYRMEQRGPEMTMG